MKIWSPATSVVSRPSLLAKTASGTWILVVSGFAPSALVSAS